MSLRRKLLLAMAIPALLLVLLGGTGLALLGHLEHAAERILADNYRTIRAARQMEAALRELELAPAVRETGQAVDVLALAQSFEDGLAICEANFTEQGESELLSDIREVWARHGPRLTGRSTADAPWATTSDGLRSLGMLEDLDRLVSLNELAMVEAEQATQHTARLVREGMALALLVTLATLAIFASVAAQRISLPIQRVSRRLRLALSPPTATASAGPSAGELEQLEHELSALLTRLDHHEHEQTRRLVRVEERLAAVLEEVLEGLILLDSHQRVVTLNGVARAVLCLGDEPIEGKPLPGAMAEALRQALPGAAGGELDLAEIRAVVNGRECLFRPRVQVLAPRDGDPGGTLLILWDVTEEQRFEEARRHFIAVLSHQLKTPLTSLTLAVNLLAERLEGLQEAPRELLDISREQTATLSSLVHELVDAARDVAPDLTLRPRKVELVTLLRAALKPLGPQADERGIHLSLPEVGASLPARVDPVKFPWVITNLVGNALRYTPRGGHVAVCLVRRGAEVEITVEDDGSGMDAQLRARAFEGPDPETVEQAGGHGLGLPIAREIVEAHRGTIAVRSSPGEGTTFTIRVPLPKESAS